MGFCEDSTMKNWRDVAIILSNRVGCVFWGVVILP